MQVMLQFAETAAEVAKRQDPHAAPAYWGAWSSYMGAIQAAGIFVTGAGLEPASTATTFRLLDGIRDVQDGPFADTKEQIGGFVIIEVPDMDTALAWAARSPCAGAGAVELRAVLPPPGPR